VHHSTLGLRVIKKKKHRQRVWRRGGRHASWVPRSSAAAPAVPLPPLRRVLRFAFWVPLSSQLGTNEPVLHKQSPYPLCNEISTNMTVKARFWPWLEPFSIRKSRVGVSIERLRTRSAHTPRARCSESAFCALGFRACTARPVEPRSKVHF